MSQVNPVPLMGRRPLLNVIHREEIELLGAAAHHEVGQVEIHGNGDILALAEVLEAYGLLRYVRGWQEPGKARARVYAITARGRRLVTDCHSRDGRMRLDRA